MSALISSMQLTILFFVYSGVVFESRNDLINCCC